MIVFDWQARGVDLAVDVFQIKEEGGIDKLNVMLPEGPSRPKPPALQGCLRRFQEAEGLDGVFHLSLNQLRGAFWARLKAALPFTCLMKDKGLGPDKL